MEKKEINFLIAICAAVIIITATLFTFKNPFEAIAAPKFSSYYCSDITLGENVVSTITSYSDLDTDTKLSKVVSPDTVLSLTDFTMTDFINANYKKSDENTYYAMKIGGTSATKYSGSFTINLLNNIICERALVYACGYSGDGGSKTKIYLSVNNAEKQEINLTTDDNYNFTQYAFENLNSSTLVLKNNEDATGKRRVLISKIVLRLRKIYVL